MAAAGCQVSLRGAVSCPEIRQLSTGRTRTHDILRECRRSPVRLGSKARLDTGAPRAGQGAVAVAVRVGYLFVTSATALLTLRHQARNEKTPRNFSGLLQSG